MPIEVIIETPQQPQVNVNPVRQAQAVVEPLAGGGRAFWGDIIGNIQNQEDLMALFDKTHGIVVSNITTGLEPYTTPGVYPIVFKHQLRPDRPDTIEIPFILLVQVSPNGDIIQVRLTPGGYIDRVKAYDSESWGEWSELYNYASKADIEEAKQWAAIGWVL